MNSIELIMERVQKAIQDTEKAVSSVDWNGTSPDELVSAIMTAEAALASVRGAIRRASEIISEAYVAAMRIERSLEALRRERHARLEKVYGATDNLNHVSPS